MGRVPGMWEGEYGRKWTGQGSGDEPPRHRGPEIQRRQGIRFSLSLCSPCLCGETELCSLMHLAFHKPYGVLSQFTPEPGSRWRTLADFGFPKGVYPIGRLDADSE